MNQEKGWMMRHKRCTKCGKEKSATTEYFPPNKQTKDKLASWCRVCVRELARILNKKNNKTLHGYLKHIFSHINQCCNNPKDKDYNFCGGYDIKNLFTFDNFFKHITVDLGFDTVKKLKGLEIGRINKFDHFRKNNIRFTTHPQSMMGIHKIQGRSSQYKGVSWDKEHQRWRSRITIDNKTTSLGRYSNEIEAAETYDKAALKLFGEFALTNTDLGLL